MTSTSNPQNSPTTPNPVTAPGTPTISVLMSVYNCEPYIREAIESILDQTYRDFEFIIIDDASTDLSSKIIENIKNERTDDRIILIKNETNIGLTKSLNKGLKIARGTYIARMDADDISLPIRLAVQKKFLDEHPEIVCVGSASKNIDKNGDVFGEKKVLTNPDEINFRLITANAINHSTAMFRTILVRNMGGYNENFRYAQDFDLWSRLSSNGLKLANIPESLIKYRLHQKSVTQSETSSESAYHFATTIITKNISQYIPISDHELKIFCNHYTSNLFNLLGNF